VTHVWRLASGRYEPLTGDGARMVGGRWNSAGRPLVYASESLALALAECLVHVPGALPQDYVAFKIRLPEGSLEVLDAGELREGWETDRGITRATGDRWFTESRSLALAVPSLILPESTNVLLNPTHPLADGLEVVSREPFQFDPRLRANR
jgi:RES domain-containing protein